MRKLASTSLCLFLATSFASQAAQDLNDRIMEMSALNRGTEYRLGRGDLIQVSVFGVEEYDYTSRISEAGEINLPFLGRVQVAEMTAVQLEEKLKQELEGRLIKNPQVFVSVKEYKSHPVFVLGAVGNPGQYQMTQQLSLIDVIAMAGGLDLGRADDYASIQRRTETGGEAGEARSSRLDVIRVNLTELLESGSLEQNVPLQAGDVIHVPERIQERFFVLGGVNGPGAYGLPKNRQLLFTQALAWAGGPSRTAKMNKGTLVRYDEAGGRKEIALNFKDIMEGKKPDFPVESNDVIFIPGSKSKSIGYAMLGLIPTAVGSVATEGGRTIVR